MLLSHPSFLWLLPLAVVPLVTPVVGRGNVLTARRRLGLATLRSLCTLCIIFALAEPVIGRRAASEPVTIWTIDVGKTVLPEDLARQVQLIRRSHNKGRAIVVAFSTRAEVLDDPSVLSDPTRLATLRTRLAEPVWPDDPADGPSNLAAALQLAGAQAPFGQHGDLRLFSSGLGGGHGDAAAEAYRLASRGIGVTVTPAAVDRSAEPAALVRRVVSPATGRVGQMIPIHVQVESSADVTAKLRLTLGGASSTTAVHLKPGLNDLDLQRPLPVAGLVPISAEVLTEGRSVPILQAAVDVSPRSHVLVVEMPGERAISAALARALGDTAEVDPISPEQLPGRDFSAVGSVVLADVPADRVPASAQAQLRRAVLGGTGLLMTGVAGSFGPGGFASSPLATLLPVHMPQQTQSVDPSTALVIIIDTSGSMKGEPIDLAKEVARLAISHLHAQDSVGVVEFYNGRRWAAPLQSASNAAVVERAIDRLSAGGGTTLFPAFEEAAFSLTNVDAQSKHVMVLSDGGVENAPFLTLARQMVDDGISVSTVQCGLGDGGYNPMPNIARAGRGRYYTVPDPYAVPDISFKQPSITPMSSMVSTPAKLQTGSDALVRLVTDTAQWPAVNGYVRTVARPTADVLLRTETGDPLLVRWRYGAGFVAALPTQLGSSLTQGLDAQPGFQSLLKSLFRQMDDARPPALTVAPSVRPGGVEVDVALADATAPAASHGMRVSLLDRDSRVVREAEAAPDAIGHWNVYLPEVLWGPYRVVAAVDGANLAGEAAVAVPAPQAVPALSADHELLDRIASFKPVPTLEPSTVYIDLQNGLAVSGIVFLLLHVGARRWSPRAA